MKSTRDICEVARQRYAEEDRDAAMREAFPLLVEALKIVVKAAENPGAQRIIAGNVGQLAGYYTGADWRQFQAALAAAEKVKS